jgi:hypothetical protein
MQQCHVLSQYGGDPMQAVHVGRRALETANRLEDEALSYGVRFALGHACWIGGDYDSTIELLSANLPENMRDPSRIRDFGTAGSLLLDSMAILAHTLAHRGHFDRAFLILERAQALPQKNAFDLAILRFHHSRAHLFRGDADLAAPLLQAGIEDATRVGLEFTLPWHQALLGYAHALMVNTKPRSHSSKPPSKDRRRCICRILPRRVALGSARRSRSGIPSEPSTSPRPRLELQWQADFVHWKRSCFESKRPRLSTSIAKRPKPPRKKVLSLPKS